MQPLKQKLKEKKSQKRRLKECRSQRLQVPAAAQCPLKTTGKKHPWIFNNGNTGTRPAWWQYQLIHRCGWQKFHMVLALDEELSDCSERGNQLLPGTNTHIGQPWANAQMSKSKWTRQVIYTCNHNNERRDCECGRRMEELEGGERGVRCGSDTDVIGSCMKLKKKL